MADRALKTTRAGTDGATHHETNRKTRKPKKGRKRTGRMKSPTGGRNQVTRQTRRAVNLPQSSPSMPLYNAWEKACQSASTKRRPHLSFAMWWPERWTFEGWGPEGWGPKFRFFPSHAANVVLSSFPGCLFVQWWPRFKAMAQPKCPFGLLSHVLP